MKFRTKQALLITAMAAILIAGTLFFSGCTENARTRNFGGNWTKVLPAGQKVVTVTWKDANLWILTRPTTSNDKPTTLTFQEDSAHGILNGTLTIKEQ